MKKLISLCFIFIFSFAGWGHAEEEKGDQIQEIINKYLNEQYFYYKDHSLNILTSMDDTATLTEGEEEREAQVKVLVVQFKEVRDSIFHFTQTKSFIYDPGEKNIFDSSTVGLSDKGIQFLKENPNVPKSLDTSSFVWLMVLFAVTFTTPVILTVFHNKDRSSVQHLYHKAQMTNY